MWSGPRNLSTALMRSFENRDDTKIIDEPFYAYYLKKTQLNHPMKNEIINNYPTSQKQIIKIKKYIFYQDMAEVISFLHQKSILEQILMPSSN